MAGVSKKAVQDFQLEVEVPLLVQTSIFSSKNTCVYTKFYCEENVWKLCEYLKCHALHHLRSCFAVFISNKNKQIPMWKQQLLTNSEEPVIWDYHVILVHQSLDTGTVYDLDSTMAFPSVFKDYITQAVRSEDDLYEKYHRKFRVIAGEVYLSEFASDRRHMRNIDGSWRKTPPPYAPIHSKESSHNLDEFTNMDSGGGWGEVLTLEQFIARFST